MIFDFNRNIINDILLYIKVKINNPDLNNIFQVINQFFQGDNINHIIIKR